MATRELELLVAAAKALAASDDPAALFTQLSRMIATGAENVAVKSALLATEVARLLDRAAMLASYAPSSPWTTCSPWSPCVGSGCPPPMPTPRCGSGVTLRVTSMKGTTVRKVAVVYNAKSGADIADGEPPVEEVLAELLAARGVVASFHAFDPKTVGPDVRKLLADGPDAVFTAGGDGTVTSVAAHLLGGDIPLGVLPAGTMNVLARDLGVPDDLEAALDSLLAASVRDIDVAEVNGRIFLCSALLALLPHLGRFRERARAKSVWMLPALFVRTWRALRRYPRMRLRVVVDGNAHTTRTRAVVVSNNPMSAGPAPMPGRDRLDSGRLAVYVARDRTPWDLAGIAAKVLDGSWQDSKRVRSHLGASVRIESGQLGMMSVMTDGEVTQLTTPLKFEIRSGALSVLAPMVRDEPG